MIFSGLRKGLKTDSFFWWNNEQSKHVRSNVVYVPTFTGPWVEQPSCAAVPFTPGSSGRWHGPRGSKRWIEFHPSRLIPIDITNSSWNSYHVQLLSMF
jgi:hypothetical protein